MVTDTSNRVACFYRVSTKKQVGRDNDLPLQEIACRQFAERKGWNIVHEYYERGVSGFKKTAAKRDVLQEAIEGARTKQYDILLVFMYDRLGRKDEETPFILHDLVNMGVRIWSVSEGEQRFDGHVDKLTTYIRYWQASGESEKTSQRVKERRRQMAEAGVWGGGNAPYGYHLVHKGRIGAKNRLLYDMEIDSIQAPVVKEIFRLTLEDNWGANRISNHLNETVTGLGYKKWSRVTVSCLLKNIAYTGRMKVNEIIGEPDEMLRIISDEQFDACQTMRENRLTRVNGKRHTPPKSEQYGARLLKGLLRCGSCGAQMTGTFVNEKRGKTTRVRPIYRCYNKSMKACGCEGQSTYSAQYVDDIILEQVDSFMKALGNYTKRSKPNLKSQELTQLRQSLQTLKRRQSVLQEETIKALTGESDIDVSNLNAMMNSVQTEVTQTERQITLMTNQSSTDAIIDITESKKTKDCITLYDGFKSCSDVEKNIVLSNIVNRISIFRIQPSDPLQINIDFKLSKTQVNPDKIEALGMCM